MREERVWEAEEEVEKGGRGAEVEMEMGYAIRMRRWIPSFA
jgi:hypothetical protein